MGGGSRSYQPWQRADNRAEAIVGQSGFFLSTSPGGLCGMVKQAAINDLLSVAALPAKADLKERLKSRADDRSVPVPRRGREGLESAADPPIAP
jgi:hypothetical protein